MPHGQRIKTMRHDYFDSIDSSVKAYILGFFMADGTIEINQSNRYCIRFIQKESDAAVLRLIQAEISPESKMGIITRGTKVYHRLSITSTQIAEALMAMGLNPRKTYENFKLPSIPLKFERDMIRGYFDGDGTAGVYIHTPKIITQTPHVVRQVRITANKQQILLDIQAILLANDIYCVVNEFGKHWYLGIRSFENWNRYLYPGITTFLRKKYNCELCMLTSSEIKSLTALGPCNA